MRIMGSKITISGYALKEKSNHSYKGESKCEGKNIIKNMLNEFKMGGIGFDGKGKCKKREINSLIITR